MMQINNSFRILSLSCRRVLQPKQNATLYIPLAGLKTIEEKVGLPPRPKKPLTPYFRFVQKLRPTVSSENPNAKAYEIVKLITAKWEEVDEATKKKLQEEYKRDQITFLETRTRYESKITNEQRDQIKQFKQEMADAKHKREMRKKIKELGKPKKPSSGFIRFLIQERHTTPQLANQTYREWHKKVTEKWSLLTDADKEPYNKETRVAIEKFRKELSKWEEKMIRLGHIDVVRRDSLIDPLESKSKSTGSKANKTKKSE